MSVLCSYGMLQPPACYGVLQPTHAAPAFVQSDAVLCMQQVLQAVCCGRRFILICGLPATALIGHEIHRAVNAYNVLVALSID